MFPFFLDLSRIHAGVASSLKIASLTSVYNRIFTYETINKGKKFLSENFGEGETSGWGSLFKSLPFKSLPYPLRMLMGPVAKTLLKAGWTGRLESRISAPASRKHGKGNGGLAGLSQWLRMKGPQALRQDGGMAQQFFSYTKEDVGAFFGCFPAPRYPYRKSVSGIRAKVWGACLSRSASLILGYRLLSPVSSCFRDWIAEEA